MIKLDQYIGLNMKMVSAHCAAMSLSILMMIFVASKGAWYLGGGVGELIAYYLFLIPLSLFPMMLALSKICYAGFYGGGAGLFRSLPVETVDMAIGKILSAGICCALGMMPVLYMVAIIQGKYGFTMDLAYFLVDRGLLPSQVPMLAGLAALQALVFMFLAAEIILLVVFMGKEKGNLSGGLIASLCVLSTAAAAFLVSIPWFLAVFLDDSIGGYVTLILGFVGEFALSILFGWFYVGLLKREGTL